MGPLCKWDWTRGSGAGLTRTGTREDLPTARFAELPPKIDQIYATWEYTLATLPLPSKKTVHAYLQRVLGVHLRAVLLRQRDGLPVDILTHF